MSSLIDDLFGKNTESSAKSSTENELSKIQYNTQEYTQLKYPGDVLDPTHGQGHFVLFNINLPSNSRYMNRYSNNTDEVDSPYSTPVVQSSNSSSLRSKTTTRQIRSNESIILGMPSNLNQNYGTQWQAGELGVAGRVLNTFRNRDGLTLRDVGNTFSEEIKRAASGAIQAVTPVNTADAVDLATQTTNNPFVEVLFKGVNNRDLNLDFKFTPRNEEESNTVRSIITRFKFHQHPEYKYKARDSAYLLYPSSFDITFMRIDSNGNATRNTWLPRVSTMALTNISTNYTPDNEYNLHNDDSPVSITLTLSFIELEQLYKGRFEDDFNTF